MITTLALFGITFTLFTFAFGSGLLSHLDSHLLDYILSTLYTYPTLIPSESYMRYTSVGILVKSVKSTPNKRIDLHWFSKSQLKKIGTPGAIF
jgi:hypothetical protein